MTPKKVLLFVGLAKVAIGVAGVAIVYFLVKARSAANQANSYTGPTPPAPAPYTAAAIAGRQRLYHV